MEYSVQGLLAYSLEICQRLIDFDFYLNYFLIFLAITPFLSIAVTLYASTHLLLEMAQLEI